MTKMKDYNAKHGEEAMMKNNNNHLELRKYLLKKRELYLQLEIKGKKKNKKSSTQKKMQMQTFSLFFQMLKKKKKKKSCNNLKDNQDTDKIGMIDKKKIRLRNHLTT